MDGLIPDVVSVFGTHNRRPLLEACVASIRRSVGPLSHVCLVCDGGSTDGSREWLKDQPDCELLEGGLAGAVKAFNVGFARAVEIGAPYVNVFNDDLTFLGPQPEIARAVELMAGNPGIGCVVWESDHHRDNRGQRSFGFERWQDLPYMNQGLTRLAVGMAVARFLGDPTGKAWWDPRFHTYAADTAYGLACWRLGWSVYCGVGLRVHDHECQDAMKETNRKAYTNSALFGRCWSRHAEAEYHREDAVRCGGLVR